jgi:hypothetical protein
MRFTEIVNEETANAFIVGQKVNSISNDVHILTKCSAELVSKIDLLLFDETFKKALGQDTEIDLGCLKATLLKLGDQLIETNKKI